MLTILLLTVLAVVIFYKIALFIYSHYTIRRKLSGIPGITSYPLIGTLPLLNASNKDRMKLILSLSNEFKDGMFLVWLGQQPILFIFKPELLQVILTSTTQIVKSKQYDMLKPWLGNGILTAPVEKWRRFRKMLQPTFNSNILMKFAVIMSKKVEILLKPIEKDISENPTKAINITSLIGNLSLDILCGKK